MKRIDLLLGFILLLAVIPSCLTAQCSRSTPICAEARSISHFPYSGKLVENFNFGGTFGGLLPGCDTSANYSLDNPNWYKINIASDNFKIQITPSNCFNEIGIQAILFPSCQDSTALASQCACTVDPAILSVDTITPGVYYLLVDGCAGDSCSFTIDLLEGIVIPDSLEMIGAVDTPSVDTNVFCPRTVVTFEVEENYLADKYEWVYSPGIFPLIVDCNRLTAVITENSDSISVSVILSNGTDTVQSPPFRAEINSYTGSESGSYCFPQEVGYFHTGTNTFYPGGTWTLNLSTADGCDSIVTLEVTETRVVPSVLNFEICPSDSVEVAGTTFYGPTSTQLFVPTSQICDSLIFVKISILMGPEFSLSATNDSCGACTGQVATNIVSGIPPYSFEWNNGMTSQNISGLCTGSYTVTITDDNGCSTSETIQVDGFSTNDLQLSFQAESSNCWADCEGSIDLLISCGTPPFTIDWSGSLPDGATSVTGLCAGVYQVQVNDSNGDTITQEIIIENPPQIQLSATISNPSCASDSTGSISLQVVGGIPNYSYEWTNDLNVALGNTTGLTDLIAGAYHVTVTDANACTATETYQITEPAELLVEIVGENVSCIGLGSATATGFGGTPPYLYEWSNSDSVNQIIDLVDGIYSVTVTDANNCTSTNSIEIEPSIYLALSSSPAGCDSMGGTATVTILSGSNNPEYAWSTGGTSANLTDLSPGWYSVTVTDVITGCNVHRNVEVPLDSICFARISGYVYDDEIDQNCAPDAAVGAPNQLIELSNGDFTTSNSDGYYEFKVPPGTYTTSLILNGTQYDELCTDPITIAATSIGSVYPDNDFFLTSSGIRNLALKVSKQNARPGFIQRIQICVMNYGSIPMDGTLTFVHDPIQEFSSGQTPTSYDMASQTLKWDFTAHPPGINKIYTVFMLTPIGTPLNTTLNMFFKVDPIAGDVDPSNNTIDCPFTVTGSSDPNDKQVTPAGEEADGNITRQDSTLSYQIRFQNTGTDTAFTVVIRDTLDLTLDIRTLLPGPSSHPYHLDIIKGNILEFNFVNIMLPDSFVNEPASNGFVFFDIQLHKELEYGTMISNTAAIYFDYNDPVITNTVKNTLRMPVGIFDPPTEAIQLSLLPNPNRGKGLLCYQLEKQEKVRIVVYDALGQQVELLQSFKEQAAGEHQLPLNLLEQQPGVYFIHIETAEGRGGVLRSLYVN